MNVQQPMRANLHKNYGSSHDLKSAESKSNEKRQEKNREAKKGRAPPPPVSGSSRIKVKITFPLQWVSFNVILIQILDDASTFNASSRAAIHKDQE